jgi:HK97 family phage prohead protease
MPDTIESSEMKIETTPPTDEQSKTDGAEVMFKGREFRRTFDLGDAKALTDGNGGIEGYASTFFNFDSYNERVEKGAFKEGLDRFIKNGWLALNHDWSSAPIGFFNTAIEDDIGLKISASFHSTTDAQEIRTIVNERLTAGKSVKMSIGYRVMDWKQDETSGGFILTKIDLFEVSIVNKPANEYADVVSAKSLDGLRLIDELRLLTASAKNADARIKAVAEMREKAGAEISAANFAELDQILEHMKSAQDSLSAFLVTKRAGKGGVQEIKSVPAEFFLAHLQATTGVSIN